MKGFIFALLLLMSYSLTAENWSNAKLELSEPTTIEVFRSPNCQCCHKWIQHLEQHQFTVIDRLIANTQTVKDEVALPKQLASCHTAIIDGYIIEGHVPADDIKRLLLDKPKGIKGLSVPQMPVGTPGMEMGPRKDSFAVISYDEQGKFAIYSSYKTDNDNNYISHKQ